LNVKKSKQLFGSLKQKGRLILHPNERWMLYNALQFSVVAFAAPYYTWRCQIFKMVMLSAQVFLMMLL